MKFLHFLKAAPTTIVIMIVLKALYAILYAFVSRYSLDNSTFWSNFWQALYEPFVFFQIIGLVVYSTLVVLYHLKSQYLKG